MYNCESSNSEPTALIWMNKCWLFGLNWGFSTRDWQLVNFSKFFGCLNLGVLAFRGWRPGLVLSSLQCLGQLPTPSNCLSPNVSTTKVGKSRFKQISYYFIVIPHILICLKVSDPIPSLSLTIPLGWSKLKHPNLLSS